MHPDWTGSPQHFVAGLLVAVALMATFERRQPRMSPLLRAATALLVTMGAEALVELVEYPILYSDRFHSTAYYDTVADIADTVVGAVAGVAIALVVSTRRRIDRRDTA